MKLVSIVSKQVSYEMITRWKPSSILELDSDFNIFVTVN